MVYDRKEMLAMTARAAAFALVVGTANAVNCATKPASEPVLGEAVGWIVIVGMRHRTATRQTHRPVLTLYD